MAPPTGGVSRKQQTPAYTSCAAALVYTCASALRCVLYVSGMQPVVVRVARAEKIASPPLCKKVGGSVGLASFHLSSARQEEFVLHDSAPRAPGTEKQRSRGRVGCIGRDSGGGGALSCFDTVPCSSLFEPLLTQLSTVGRACSAS